MARGQGGEQLGQYGRLLKLAPPAIAAAGAGRVGGGAVVGRGLVAGAARAGRLLRARRQRLWRLLGFAGGGLGSQLAGDVAGRVGDNVNGVRSRTPPADEGRGKSRGRLLGSRPVASNAVSAVKDVAAVGDDSVAVARAVLTGRCWHGDVNSRSARQARPRDGKGKRDETR